MQRLETDCDRDFLDSAVSVLNRRAGFLQGSRGSMSSGEAGGSVNSQSEEDSGDFPDDTILLQASVFIEDAIKYRSIHHRIDHNSLLLYKKYFSRPVQGTLSIVIGLLLLLPFFEYPSSLTASSDPRAHPQRYELPCGATEAIEFLCLLLLLVNIVIKSYLKGELRDKWLVAYIVVISVSWVDWFVSVGFGCSETVRIRRYLRPFFLLQQSSLMKKTVNCLRRTLPQVINVLVLLFMHLYVFALIGMLLFPKDRKVEKNGTTTESPLDIDNVYDEQKMYFSTLIDAFINLLVLLTTANNPDVTMPAYNSNRFYSIYFIAFLAIGLYCFMNMLTAVIYNQFRGYFLDSMQASLFRRRLGIRAAYETLRVSGCKYGSTFNSTGLGVPVRHLRAVVDITHITQPHKHGLYIELDDNMGGVLNAAQFQEVFRILEMDLRKGMKPTMRDVQHPCLQVLQRVCAHRWFTYVGCAVAFINIICISVELIKEYDEIRTSNNTALGLLNLIFVIYYIVEQSLKIWALGLPLYAWHKGNIFDGVITLLLAVTEIIYIIMFGFPFWGSGIGGEDAVVLWDLVRIVNLLIILRLFRIISQIKSMFVVASTLVDLVKNLKAFAGIMVVIFYSYALLGIQLFANTILYDQNNTTNMTSPYVINYPCGTYEQLEYWANNFDDFWAALVVLWNIMVVNQWHVFMDAYVRHVSRWTCLYFIVWWLLSVVICLNLFTALILENFIMRWDRMTETKRERTASTTSEMERPSYLTVHDMFRGNLQEPSEEALLIELHLHSHIHFRS